MVNENDLATLLGSSVLQNIEFAITKKMNCELYKSNLSLLTRFLKEEVDASMLSIFDIEKFMKDHTDEVITFGQFFLSNAKIQSLSTGIAITYSIYIIYLKEKDENELLLYLKKRRIPREKQLLEKLLFIKKQMNL